MVAKVDYPTGCYDDGHKSFQFDGWLEPHPQTRNKIKLTMRHFGWNRRQRGVSGTYLRKLVVRYSLHCNQPKTEIFLHSMEAVVLDVDPHMFME